MKNLVLLVRIALCTWLNLSYVVAMAAAQSSAQSKLHKEFGGSAQITVLVSYQSPERRENSEISAETKMHLLPNQ